MKKTLLIAAAALAAGIISTQAQVYSQNIVGYVNKPLPLGFVNVANPLVGSNGNNSITNLIDVFSGNYDGSGLYIWNGAGYTQYTIDSSWSTGVGNAADTAQATPPVIAPGNAIFLANSTGLPLTNTFVGNVYTGGSGASTNVVGLATNSIPTGFHFIASQMAVGGGLASVLQFPALGGNLDGAAIYVPNIVGGNVQGFVQYTVDSGWATGFGNAADTAQVAEPVIPVGSGFFINNSTGLAQEWIQNL